MGALRALLRRETAARTWAAVFVYAIRQIHHGGTGFAFPISAMSAITCDDGDLGNRPQSPDQSLAVQCPMPHCALPSSGCSPRLRASVVGFGFPIPRDVGDLGDSYSLLPASLSQTPTPHNTFVEYKSQTPIRPNGDRPVEAPSLCFLAFQSGPISALFSRFRCPVGRGSQALAANM
jgi:hypothetical protein